MRADTLIPGYWSEAVALIQAKAWRKVLVVGETDRGKSTFCRYLLTELTKAKYRSAYIDADVGQKDVGPPATVTLANLDGHNLLLRRLYFVGSTNPARHLLPLLVGVREIMDYAGDADHVIIDTSGFVHRSGFLLQSYQIELLAPDVIVGIERRGELHAIFHAYRNFNTLILQEAEGTSIKTVRERAAVRRDAFARYFRSSRMTEIPLDRLAIQRTHLFNGQRIEDPRWAHSELFPQGGIAVSRSRERNVEPKGW